MVCEHAATTTVAWLYGEADEGHIEHVQQCAACQAVAAEHADVAVALGPSLGAVRTRPAVSRRWAFGVIAMVAALLVWAVLPARSPAPSAALHAEPLPVAMWPVADDFDAELDALDVELQRLSNDLEML